MNTPLLLESWLVGAGRAFQSFSFTHLLILQRKRSDFAKGGRLDVQCRAGQGIRDDSFGQAVFMLRHVANYVLSQAVPESGNRIA
ncbi:hypothetical protein J1605_003100 [Eschrichtius robustus]|uniref:Uncharacterized protein n=1 Tax=Eschrichtius robustus TaxID=9764 RepID=A0AB34HVZ4_ESCRO|nr:hypothetical protein J1605_003100 [Eschrichtius robustus]